MRIVVTGGRDFNCYETVQRALWAVHKKHGIDCLIQGNARGADTLSLIWAQRNHIPHLDMPADWSAHGKRAGHIRNQQMIDEGKPDAVVAFPGGRGTADMIARCEKAGLPIWRVQPAP